MIGTVRSLGLLPFKVSDTLSFVWGSAEVKGKSMTMIISDS